MKTNNRPMVKVVEYEWVCNRKHVHWAELNQYCWQCERYFSLDWYRTGKTRKIERPMNDTEYIEYLEKENQELKEQMSFNNKLFLDTFKVQKEQFLKVVENVLKKHDIDTEYLDCSCGFDFVNSKTNEWEHLLKEIRKAMENGE